MQTSANTPSWILINHVTIRFALCYFLLVVLWNRSSISNAFRDICIQVSLGHDLDLLGSRNAVEHLPISGPASISCRCSIVTESVSPAVFEIMDPKHIGVTTFTSLGHMTSSITWPFDSLYAIFLLAIHWNRASISNYFWDIRPQKCERTNQPTN